MNNKKIMAYVAMGLACLTFTSMATRAGETISVEEFARRCEAGPLMLTQDLKVAQGSASLSGGCTVNVPSYQKFETEDVALVIRGDFIVRGGEKSEIIIAQTQIVQIGVPHSGTPAAIRLTTDGAEGLVKVQQSTLIVELEVLLQADGGHKGRSIVQQSEIRSYLESIHVFTSRNHSEGLSEVSESLLFAEGDIQVNSGDQRNGHRGEAKLQESAAVAWRNVRVMTGRDGRTLVQQNDHDWRMVIFDETHMGIDAMEEFVASSGPGGETIVQQNLAHGMTGVIITSGRKTVVQENDFTGSDPIRVHSDGECTVSQNIPDIMCE